MRVRGTRTPASANRSTNPAVRSIPVLAYGSPAITATVRCPSSRRCSAASRPPA